MTTGRGPYRVGDAVVPVAAKRPLLPPDVADEVGEVVLVTPRHVRARFPSGRIWHFLPRELEPAPPVSR
ncbi:hypothetical protein D3C72_688490 [compost metagenome]